MKNTQTAAALTRRTSGAGGKQTGAEDKQFYEVAVNICIQGVLI